MRKAQIKSGGEQLRIIVFVVILALGALATMREGFVFFLLFTLFAIATFFAFACEELGIVFLLFTLFAIAAFFAFAGEELGTVFLLFTLFAIAAFFAFACEELGIVLLFTFLTVATLFAFGELSGGCGGCLLAGERKRGDQDGGD